MSLNSMQTTKFLLLNVRLLGMTMNISMDVEILTSCLSLKFFYN